MSVAALDAEWRTRGARLVPGAGAGGSFVAVDEDGVERPICRCADGPVVVTALGENAEAFRRRVYAALRGGWRPPVRGALAGVERESEAA